MPRRPGNQGPRGAPAERPFPPSWLPWAVFLAALLFTSAVRVRLLDVPLERDEGEYGYAGQLILQGIPPYKLAYNMKPPGTYAAYAVLMAVFGQTPRGIHLGLLLVSAASSLLVMRLGQRLQGPLAGGLAGAAYAVLSTSRSVLGPFAHASHFVVLAGAAGILLLLRARESGRAAELFAAGVLLGTAVLMKQHGAFFVAFAVFVLARDQFVGRAAIALRPAVIWSSFTAGVAAPVGLTCLVLWLAGSFGKFWFWTVQYARQYVTELPLSVAFAAAPGSFASAIGSSVVFWVLAGAGLIALFRDPAARPVRWFLLPFAAFSFLSICPGLYFRSHYFITLLPAIGLLAALGACWAGRLIAAGASPPARGAIAIAAIGVAAGVLAYGQRDVLFTMGMREVSRAIYGANPFPESLEIGRYIRAHSSEGDTVAVFGSEPQIYFYSGRHSATGYIYTYGLMEPQPFASRMQDEMIAEITAARPKFCVFVTVSTSWLLRAQSDQRILSWAERFLGDHYETVGVADILFADQTEYRWGSDAASYKPQSRYNVMVYRRRDG